MKNNKPTFSEILRQTGKTNSEILMTKARIANRLAKTARGRNRHNAYQVKANALRFLVEKLPNKVRVSEDFYLSEFLVVTLENERSGLHTPVNNLRGN